VLDHLGIEIEVAKRWEGERGKGKGER